MKCFLDIGNSLFLFRRKVKEFAAVNESLFLVVKEEDSDYDNDNEDEYIHKIEQRWYNSYP